MELIAKGWWFSFFEALVTSPEVILGTTYIPRDSLLGYVSDKTKLAPETPSPVYTCGDTQHCHMMDNDIYTLPIVEEESAKRQSKDIMERNIGLSYGMLDEDGLPFEPVKLKTFSLCC